MNSFEEVKIAQSGIDPFELKNKWMLVTAQKENGEVNTMTASWGGFGVMWNKEVVFVVIRPQRYTKEFVDDAESFSLTFFDDVYKKQLGYLGKISGKYHDTKIKDVEFTVVHDEGIPYFKEAEKVLIAKKLYAQPMNGDCFIDKSIIDKCFPEKDFHILYIAEITKILKK